MISKREIVLELRRIHVGEHRAAADPECPFCQRTKDNADRLMVTFHEEPLQAIIRSHMEHWDRMGARIANRIGAHRLPMELVVQILNSWMSMRVDLPDTPEDYLDHPLVVHLFEQQKNEDSE